MYNKPTVQLHIIMYTFIVYRQTISKDTDAGVAVSMVVPSAVYKIILRCPKDGGLSECALTELEPLAFIVSSSIDVEKSEQHKVLKGTHELQ